MPLISCATEQLKEEQLYRELQIPTGIDFSSNDYLGLSQHSDIRARLIEALNQDVSLSSTGSRLISGNTRYHVETEEFLSSFLGRQSSLLFNSGYAANEGVISTLGKDSIIFSDELNHSSIIRGIQLSRSPFKIFRHNDTDHLESLLSRELSKKQRIVVTESLFSMDGDLAPLQDLVQLANKYSCLLIVDEAHATGVFGSYGQGCLFDLNFNEEMVVSIHTGGKALGANGAFIGCSEEIKKFLVNSCHHFIYSTAPPPLQCLHLQYSVEVIKKEGHLRRVLFKNVEIARELLEKNFEINESFSQIMPIVLGSNAKVLFFSQHLRERGFCIVPIRYPTVAKGGERLRISIRTEQEAEQIHALFGVLAELKDKYD